MCWEEQMRCDELILETQDDSLAYSLWEKMLRAQARWRRHRYQPHLSICGTAGQPDQTYQVESHRLAN